MSYGSEREEWALIINGKSWEDLTFPKLLLEHAKIRPSAPAIREKDLGIWQTWSWREVENNVKWLAYGLANRGLKRGMSLGIIGDNRPRLYWGFSAAQALGAIPVPIYHDSIAEEMLYVIENAEIKYALVEDQEQVDKLIELLPKARELKTIIYDDERGLTNYTEETIVSYQNLELEGKAQESKKPELFEEEIYKGKPEDICTIMYTSGTTGKPKGVCLTHKSFLSTAPYDVKFDNFNSTDSILSYLPMAWVGDHVFSYVQALVAGYTVNCPESSETVMTDLREVGPTYYFAPPRLFENILTQVMIRIEDAGKVKKWLFHSFMSVAKRCGVNLLDGKQVGLVDRILYFLGDILVYGPLRNRLGMSKVRAAYTGGAAIGPDLYEFYRSIGINLKQLYGQTETSVYVCKQPNHQAKSDSVGIPMPGVDIKIDREGEILVKSPGLLKEYYKQPEATQEAITKDGYFRTGDAGFLDEDGHLKIIDRSKDVGKLKDGGMFAPQFLENKLKFFSFIKEAVCFGNDRDAVCAFINIDMEAVGSWAEKKGMPYAGYVDLAGKSEVYTLVAECINEVNRDLSIEPKLASSQIARFLILHKELDADDDELTRTRKVRRRFIAEKYQPLVKAFYDGAKECTITTKVKFEDGRTGEITATVKIQDVTQPQHKNQMEAA